jgi:chromosome partitioning protein
MLFFNDFACLYRCMPHVIGLVNQKGGVGKTTAALNIAAELSRRGSKILLLDADPAGAAQSIAEEGRLPFPVETHYLENEDVKDQHRVQRWVNQARQASADFVIIDAPGALGAAFGVTIAAADLVVVPSGATTLDLRGAVDTLRIVRQLRRKSGKPDVLIMPSRIDKRTSAGREAVSMLAALTEPVGPVISYRAIVADSLAAGEPVPPGSDSAAEFSALTDAVLTRLGDRL